MEPSDNRKKEKELLNEEITELVPEKKEKHLKDFSEEEIKMIKLMSDIIVKNLLEKKNLYIL